MPSSNQLAETLRALGIAIDPSEIRGVSTLEHAGPHDLCFAESAVGPEAISVSRAGHILVGEDFAEVGDGRLVRVADPRRHFFAIAECFVPEPEITGIHPSAVIHPAAELGEGVAIGACAVVSAGVRIGPGSRIGCGVYLGPGVSIGRDCLLAANVTIQRDCAIGDRCVLHPGVAIGGDGFGFRWDGSGHRKVPQLGRVVIEDDVEIGCNSCVDRATLGITRVGRGTKIDNLVQVAHNVVIGQHCIFAGQAGVAGSSTLGNGVVVAGQVAISDHLRVGDGAQLGGQAGVVKDIAPKEAVFGTPARPVRQALRENAALARLPDLLKQVKHQQDLIERLEARLVRLEQGGGD